MNFPSRIARYHVLGRIAYGGMAEILLAKVLGPGGFERPVVIKRVLPHMASEREFRDMFLDEARIVAAIHHPNVVQVHELGREDGELFLVMEYLAGESVRSLAARAAARNVRLSLGLCAQIVADACAGLHAAHEFTGPDGKLLQVVHRDVCPNNLIVTYEGSVKVVDFGIALAADRFTMTQAGQVKGKAAYMAPEQCLGRPIDRRTDVFALGVLLYELTTGHRVFGEALESRVIGCLQREEVQPPSRVLSGYPKELERICMRALRFSPAERYETAEEMRRELVRFQRERATDLLPEEQLRKCMHELFEDRIAQKAEMLCQLRSGSGVSHIPAAEVAEEVSIPVVQTDRRGPDTGPIDIATRVEAATRVPLRRTQRARRRLILLGAAVATSACVALAAIVFITRPAHGALRMPPVRPEALLAAGSNSDVPLAPARLPSAVPPEQKDTTESAGKIVSQQPATSTSTAASPASTNVADVPSAKPVAQKSKRKRTGKRAAQGSDAFFLFD